MSQNSYTKYPPVAREFPFPENVFSRQKILTSEEETKGDISEAIPQKEIPLKYPGQDRGKMLLCPSRIGIRAAVIDDIAEELLLRLGPRLIPRSGVSAKLDGPQFQLLPVPVDHAVCPPCAAVTEPGILLVDFRSAQSQRIRSLP